MFKTELLGWDELEPVPTAQIADRECDFPRPLCILPAKQPTLRSQSFAWTAV
jgi:hypothetical protein